MDYDLEEPVDETPAIGKFSFFWGLVVLVVCGTIGGAIRGAAFFGSFGLVIWLATRDWDAFVALSLFGAMAGVTAFVVGSLVLWFFDLASREPSTPESSWPHMVAAVAWWTSPFFGAAFKVGGALFSIASRFSTPAGRHQARRAAAGAMILSMVVALQLTVAACILPIPIDNTGRAIGMGLIFFAAGIGGAIGAMAGRDDSCQ